MDRATHGPAVVVSKKGGMDIEAVAEESPEDIKTYPIDFLTGLTSDLAEEICTYLELAEGKQYNNGVDQL